MTARTLRGDGKVRYAVVGLGHVAQTAVLPAFKHARDNSELVALVSDNRTKRETLTEKYKASATYSFDEFETCLQNDAVDAVYLALPNHLHHEYAVRAAQAGVHVLCEKPMAVTEQECEEMIRAADDNGVKLMIAYRLHFEEANMNTIELARSGELGEPRFFNSVFAISVTDPHNIRLSPIERGGGTLYDIGVYCINAARFLFDAEPYELFAWSANSGERRFRQCDEMTSAVLRFPGERLAAFTCSFGAEPISEYQIAGPLGHVRLDPAYEYAEPLRQYVTIDGHTEEHKFGRRDQFAAELSYFSNCVLRDEEPEPSGLEGLADVRIIRAAYESAARGQPVRLPPMPRDRRPSIEQAILRPPVPPPEQVHTRSPSGR